MSNSEYDFSDRETNTDTLTSDTFYMENVPEPPLLRRERPGDAPNPHTITYNQQHDLDQTRRLLGNVPSRRTPDNREEEDYNTEHDIREAMRRMREGRGGRRKRKTRRTRRTRRTKRTKRTRRQTKRRK